MPPTLLIQSFFENVTESFGSPNLKRILSLRTTAIEKSDGSYVTKGDLLAQDLIFSSAQKMLPSPFFVSEELADEGLAPSEKQIIVVVDPIDGTENFVSGLSEWGVSIACFQGDKHIGSLIGLPEQHVWLRTGQNIARYQSRIRGLSSSLSKEQLQAATSGFEYRVMGCCVYNMLNVIRGSFHSFENPKGAWSWDILAGLNLAIEHGLNVEVEGRQYAGEYLQPTCKYRFKIEQR